MNDKVITISTKIQKQLAEKLKNIAKKKGLRFSSFLQQIIKDVIDKEENE